MKIVIIGAGAFGRAIKKVALANGPAVLLGRSPAEGVETRWRPELADADLIALAAPAQETRSVLRSINAQAPLLMLAKGLEKGTGALQSQIADQEAPGQQVGVLTGPSFASELMDGLPTAVTLAATDSAWGQAIQERLGGPALRPYLSDDVIGAQIGGALKNVVAIACGIATGRNLGESARAALMTRGYAEIVKIAVARGARPETLGGLSGLGDLMLTCSSPKSRNFSYGVALGEGREAPGETQEGKSTSLAAVDLARQMNIDAPIIETVNGIVTGSMDVDEAIGILFSRALKREFR